MQAALGGNDMYALKDLIAGYAQEGCVTWLGLRGERRGEMSVVDEALITEAGLEGDHGRAGKRAVTLIQAEHLQVIGAMLGQGAIDVALMRRNIVVSGLNLNALKARRVAVGAAVLEVTTICAPCSRMEETFGTGGYSAVRGHGGWCARVIVPGWVHVGSSVYPVD